MAIISKAFVPSPFKGIGGNHDRLHPQLRDLVLFCRITRLDTIKREIKKMASSYWSF